MVVVPGTGGGFSIYLIIYKIGGNSKKLVTIGLEY
jgi:hypothetical protein